MSFRQFATPNSRQGDVDTRQDNPLNDDDDDLISDLDARVLQSLLQDANKLDLQQEANMKKLLERGISSKDRLPAPEGNADNNQRMETNDDEEEIPYSSQVLQTLADTKLWRQLKRNAADWAESAKIALSNRIERDAKLVAALGIFTLERALKDVSRALPAASSAINSTPARKIFQLSDTSSYQEPQSPPNGDRTGADDESNELSTADLRREFSTPQDEIRAVSKEIQTIFQQADQQVSNNNNNVSPFFATRATKTASASGSASTLKSTARRGSARLDKAYKRQKETTLAREKENVAQTGTRLASKLVDSAYQVQREIQVEPNEPGYKTKRLRQATASTARQLAAAAAKTSANLLSAAQNGQKRGTALPSSSSTTTPSETSPTASVEAKPVDILDEQTYFAFRRDEKRISEPSSSSTTTTMEGLEENTIKQSSTDVDVVEATIVSTSSSSIGIGSVDVKDNTNENTNNFIDPDLVDVGDDVNYSSIYANMANAGATTGIDSTSSSALYTDTVVVDDNVITESVSVDREGLNSSSTSPPTAFASEVVDSIDINMDADNTIRQVVAEVISDDDFDGAVGDAKVVDNMSAEELLEAMDAEDRDDTNRGPPNLLVQLSLRSLDVVFLVVEKVILVLPVVATVSTRVSTRFVEVSRDGAGQKGWQQLKTNVRGDRRY